MKKGIDQRYTALLTPYGEYLRERGDIEQVDRTALERNPVSFDQSLHILLLRELLSGSSAGFLTQKPIDQI